jgi:hypothetical protein
MPSIDPDLQTEILKELRDAAADEYVVGVDGYSAEEFYYNARQLNRKGLIDIQDRGTIDNRQPCWATGLTPQGHDVLKQAEDEWKRKIKAAGGQAGQITLQTALREIVERIMS